MTLEMARTKRKEVFFNFLRDHAPQRFTSKEIVAALDVPPNYFVTDIRKWMLEEPEYRFIHRDGEGFHNNPYIYYYDVTKTHEPLKPSRTQAKGRAARRASASLEKATRPAFVRNGGRSNVLVGELKPAGRLGETFAQVIFQEGNRVILVTDKDQLIQGRIMIPGT